MERIMGEEMFQKRNERFSHCNTHEHYHTTLYLFSLTWLDVSYMLHKNAYSEEAKTDFVDMFWMNFVFEYKVDIVFNIL